VIAEVPEARLTILGDGPLFDKCQKFITTHHLSEQVSMLGSQPQSVVKSELKKAAIYVQHSVTDKEGNKEGWPISIAEAAASGLPIVSTRHAGIKDQVLEGKSGFLVDERDYANMAAKIIQLLRNDSEREALGKESFRHITEVGSLDSQLSKLSEVLSK
jgi:colanic acid/amylovoran biosynthesis glycosyltransferase